MSKRIYVGNLPWSVGKEELEEAFSKFGEIEDSIVITNKYTGRSRGFGFVTFKNDADAEKAIGEMHEKELEGRKVLVKEARPMKSDINASPEEIGISKKEERSKPDESKQESKDEGESEASQESQQEKGPESTKKDESERNEENDKNEDKK